MTLSRIGTSHWKSSLAVLAATLALSAIAAAPAQAGAMYSFSFSTLTPLFGPSVAGSGIFTLGNTSSIVDGQTAFSVVSITGQVNGANIVAPLGSYGNYFTTGPGFLDGTGLTFFTSTGNRVDFFLQDFVDEYRINTFSPGSSNFVTATSALIPAAVPEPASWTIMLASLGLMGGALLHRRRNKQAAAFAA